MALRKMMAFNALGFLEEMASTDTAALGGLALTGNVNLQSAGRVTNLLDAGSSGDAISFGQAAANLAGLTLTGALIMSSYGITQVAAPVNPSDAATKSYVDSLVSGISWKAPVRAVQLANQPALTGLPTIDGVTLTDGQRVLLAAQTTASQNGPWVVHAGVWARPADFASGATVGVAAFFVEDGTTYSDTGWTIDSTTGVIDTAALAVVQFTSTGTVVAGNGLTKTGNTFSVNVSAAQGTSLVGGALNVLATAANPGVSLLADGLQTKQDPNGGLQHAPAGDGVKLADATLSAAAAGLKVLGVPAAFTLGGAATSANVSAANLGTLTAGTSSDAQALHTHANLAKGKFTYNTVSALAAGDPVYWSSTANQVDKAQANMDAKAFVVGVNDSSAPGAGGAANIVSAGLNAGVLTGATPGATYWLQATGGLGTAVPGAGGNRIVRVGFAINATDLFVSIQEYGRKI